MDTMPEKVQEQNQEKIIHRLVFFAAIGTPIVTLPQVYQIWVLHQKVLIAIICLIYGIETKDKPIIIMQSLCILVYSSVVIGLIFV
jgi:hypothetical protein